MLVEEVVKITNQLLKTRSSNSNTFKLKQHKNMIVYKKKEIAEANGLDPDTITSTVTTKWMKVVMIVTAATAVSISLSKKNSSQRWLRSTSSRIR